MLQCIIVKQHSIFHIFHLYNSLEFQFGYGDFNANQSPVYEEGLYPKVVLRPDADTVAFINERFQATAPSIHRLKL